MSGDLFGGVGEAPKPKKPKAKKLELVARTKEEDAMLTAACHGTLSGFRNIGALLIRDLLELASRVERCEKSYAHMLGSKDVALLKKKSEFIDKAIDSIMQLGEAGNEIFQRAPKKGS